MGYGVQCALHTAHRTQGVILQKKIRKKRKDGSGEFAAILDRGNEAKSKSEVASESSPVSVWDDYWFSQGTLRQTSSKAILSMDQLTIMQELSMSNQLELIHSK